MNKLPPGISGEKSFNAEWLAETKPITSNSLLRRWIIGLQRLKIAFNMTVPSTAMSRRHGVFVPQPLGSDMNVAACYQPMKSANFFLTATFFNVT
ncbi:MAG: hypothetical protein ABI114_15400 [Rhodanobacter sp.]